MQLLENKKYIESIIELIIKDPEKYEEDTKNKYIDILKSNEEYQKTLLQYLNNYRGNGRTGFDKSTIIIFSDLFKLILDRAVKNNKYELVNLIIVLSLTYYHLKEVEIPENKTNDNKNNNNNDENEDNNDNNNNNGNIENIDNNDNNENKDNNNNNDKNENKDNNDDNDNNNNNDNNDNNGKNKIYISEYLKQDKVFQDSSFWQKYLDELIKIELEKLKRIKDISLITEKQNMNVICSSILTLIQNMLDYALKHELILSIFAETVEKYNIDDDNKLNISNYLSSKMSN
jgi:hypothetical protein